MSASGVDVVVRGGRVVTSTDVVEAAVAIRGDKIVAIGPEFTPAEGRPSDRRLGKLVLPGLIDCHLHVGPEYDDWRTAPLAAARTGLTTLPALRHLRRGETLPRRPRAARGGESLSVLDFGFHFNPESRAVTSSGDPRSVPHGRVVDQALHDLQEARQPHGLDQFIAQTMEKLAELGGLCQLHCENGDVSVTSRTSDREGRTQADRFSRDLPGLDGRKRRSPRDPYRRLTGCPVYVVHLSTRLGLERIKRAQAEGCACGARRVRNTCCSPTRRGRLGPFAKIGPPLRPRRSGIGGALAGSAQANIANLASDHSPRVPAAKEPGRPTSRRRAGQAIPSARLRLETLAPLAWNEGVVKRGLPPTWLARVMAENPARIFGALAAEGA